MYRRARETIIAAEVMKLERRQAVARRAAASLDRTRRDSPPASRAGTPAVLGSMAANEARRHHPLDDRGATPKPRA